MQPSEETILDVFNQVDKGELAIATFNNTNVVLMSREYYNVFLDSFNEKTEKIRDIVNNKSGL